MASKSSSPVRTLYQCSECKYCSQNLEEATLHAVQVHGDDDLHEESEEETLSKINIKEDKDFLSEEETSSISLYKQSNGNLEEKDENSTSSNWPPEATKLLIESVHEHLGYLKDKRSKKKHIWEIISFTLENQFPELSPSKCEQKWKSLITAQKKYDAANNNKSFGKSKVKKPEFYDEIVEVIGGNISDINMEGESDSIEGSDVKKKNDNVFSYQQDEVNTESFLDTLNRSNVQGSDAVHLLGRLLSTLERREAANERFQREIIEIEKEKLRCVQRFLESREKFNSKRCQMMREWMSLQARTKRKRDE